MKLKGLGGLMGNANSDAGLSKGTFLERLDDELLAIRDSLATGKRLTAVKVVVRELLERHTHHGNAIGSEPNCLVQSDWETKWKLGQRIYLGVIDFLRPRLNDDQQHYLREVCRAMVQFVVDGENSHLQVRFGQNLGLVIDDYLSTRGIFSSLEPGALPEARGHPMEEIDRFRRLAGAANRKARPVWERQRVAEYLADWKYAEFALAELDANETLDLSVEPLIKLTRMLDLHGDSQVLDEMEQERDEDFDTGGATKQCEYAVLTALRLLRGVQPAIRKARELLLQARHALGAKVRRNGLAKALNRIGIELCKRYPIPGFAKVDLRTYAAFGPGVRPKTESLAARVPAPAPSTTDSSGFNGQGPAKFANADIPTEKRTRPMTLSEAARYMGYTKGQKGSGKRAPAKRVSGGIKSGAIPAIRRNRQTYIFNIDNFPAAALKRVLPTE